MIAKNIGSLTAGLHFNAVLNMDIIHFLLTLLWCWGRVAGLVRLEGGSCEIAGDQVGCSHRADGFVHVASSMTAEHVQHTAVQRATPPVLQAAKRQVPKLEKQQLLQPQHIPLEVGAGEHVASTVECYSFINFEDGAFVGCWLDGDGQVFLDMVDCTALQRWWMEATLWCCSFEKFRGVTEAADEFRPYQVSSKQLPFVIVADGGAQHNVELAFGCEDSTLSQDRAAPAVGGDPAWAPIKG
ncbi:unnamed protein product, partial [Symbiodinium microadriaticum]